VRIKKGYQKTTCQYSYSFSLLVSGILKKMNDENAQIHFWERVEVLRDPSHSLKTLVEAAGMRFDVALVMKKRDTLPPVNQVCALARELGVSVEWLMSSETVDALEHANTLDEGQRARIRALALRIMNSSPDVLVDVEKTLNLD